MDRSPYLSELRLKATKLLKLPAYVSVKARTHLVTMFGDINCATFVSCIPFQMRDLRYVSRQFPTWKKCRGTSLRLVAIHVFRDLVARCVLGLRPLTESGKVKIFVRQKIIQI